ncbi:MAG: serine/threonine protein kinase, partial [Myxococcales bacterium]|nr:serine/threonine protein kinase [Myxococcales bacterium]
MTGSSRGVEEPDSGITYDERVHLRPGALVPGTRYRLERWLGEGSMGVVYEALHVDIERRVALKILHHEVSDHELVLEGFQTEARASARIGAPNIVEVFDFATLADGRPLMAMEYLEGSSVDRVLEDLRADPGRLIGVMRQVCKGLGAAHEAGIVHRDIKPDNIMLVERAGRRDFVKIVDFGVAAPIDRSGETGRLVGTPSYIAPEIVRREAFDGRVDVYAVGCVMYEALVGEPPFVGSSTEHILHLQLEARPVRPSERAPSAAPPPRALEAVVMRCLAKKPGDRYRDMADLEAALCEAQIADGLHSAWDDLPLPEVDAERRAAILKGMPDPARLVRSARRRGFLVAGGGLLVAIVVVLVTLSGVLNPSGAGHPDVERLRRAALDRAARALYVYPPAEEPRAVTAYQLIRELEELDHDEDYAQTIASELRDEFAETLNRLGDRYWSREGGLPFAIDYYAQTLLFVPDDAHARERASVSPGTLAALHQRASSGEFAEAELVAVEPLRVLAEPDEAERDR